MNIIYNIIGIAGAFFLITSMIGVIKFQDLYMKIHASALMESLAVPCFMISFAFYAGDISFFFKILFLIIIIFLTGPINTQIIAKIFYNKNNTHLT
jgi:multicomponent Na+:H+ antiporter subunit G